MGKKYFFFALLFFGANFFISGFGPSEDLYKQLKTQITSEFKKATSQEIEIGSVSGILLNQITLHDVKISDIAIAKEIDVYYNPLKALWLKGDFLPAISKVVVKSANLSVIRDKKDSWNASKLSPPGPAGAPSGPPPFKGVVEFKDCYGLYTDEKGYGSNPVKTNFTANVSKLNGSLNMKPGNRMQLNLTAQIVPTAKNNATPVKVALSGTQFLDRVKLRYVIDLDNLDLSVWGDYALPIPNLKVLSGNADVKIDVSLPMKFICDAALRDTKVELLGQPLENISGTLRATEKSVDFNGLTFSSANYFPAQTVLPRLSGTLNYWPRLDLNLKVNADNVTFKNFAKSLPVIASLPQSASGKNSLSADITGTLPVLKISADLFVLDGNLRATGLIDTSTKFTGLSFAFSAKQLNLDRFNLPGIAGLFSGNLSLRGNSTALNGNLSGNFNQALLFGQPVSTCSGEFDYVRANLIVKQFIVATQGGELKASGVLDEKAGFNFSTSCRGITLRGYGVLGEMSATINNFKGGLAGKFNEAFFNNPLKNLNAAGDLTLSDCCLGKQKIDGAKWSGAINGGKIQINNLEISRRKSLFIARGQTGVGVDTNLTITSESFDLSDISIFDQFLPTETRTVKGQGSLKAQITGNLGDKIKSVDTLLGLNLEGKIKLKSVKTDSSVLNSAQADLYWKDRSLVVDHLELYGPQTSFFGSLRINSDNTLDGSGHGLLELGLLQPFLAKQGRLNGDGSVRVELQGSLTNPVADLDLNCSPISFSQFKARRLIGKVRWANHKLLFLNQALAEGPDGTFTLYGEIDFSSSLPYLKLAGSADKAKVNSLLVATQQYLIERDKTFKPSFEKGKLIAPKPQSSLYILNNGTPEGFLKLFSQATRSTKQATQEEYVFSDLDGTASGTFSLWGPTNNLQGDFDVALKEGRLRNFKFDTLNLKAGISGETIAVNQCVLKKDNGQVNAQGSLDFKGGSSLMITFESFPLGILEAVFPQESNFSGGINGTALLEGTALNPKITSALTFSRPRISGLDFDSVKVDLGLEDFLLKIEEITIKKNNHVSYVKGDVPLVKGNFNLLVSIEGDAIGIMNLFTRDIKWRSGDCRANLSVQGPNENIDIDGSIEVSNGKIYTSALDSQLSDISGTASIANSKATIPFLSAKWIGARTNWNENQLAIAGTLGLRKALAYLGKVDLDLRLADTSLNLEWPGIYSGELDLNDISIVGPFATSSHLTQVGPKVKGKITLNGGIAYLPQGKKEVKAYVYYLYDLNINFLKRVSVLSGDPTKIDISSMIMNMEVADSSIDVHGSSVFPSIVGKIGLSGGNLSVLGREFEVLSEKDQGTYYPLNQEKINPNYVEFRGGEKESGTAPYMNVTALSQITELSSSKDENNNPIINKETYYVITRIQGTTLGFEAFKEDSTQSPPTLTQMNYTESQIRIMLLPDFLKGALGLSPNSAANNNEAAGAIMDDYINNYIRSRLIKNVERDLEKNLGLESLTLSYNFGSQLRRSVTGPSAIDDRSSNALGVGFVKGFFDRLYLNVRYIQYFEQSAENTRPKYFNYEITYKLTKVLSLSYFREPDDFTVQDLNSGYYKATLKAGYQF